ncbi:SAM-dependent methyltransferase [Actinophytocola sp. NPDC049390]|uniref:SAM-dependent methyltransferase n=1 Tax=Actinophytocola sp. NPDC049390 TaxID=3363894 RepID=UPI0037B8A6A3
MAATVTLIGLAGGQLPCGAAPALASARLVVGFAAALNTVRATARVGGGPGAPRTIEVPRAPGLPDTALDALAAAVAAGEPAVVLVPGDPGYFGALGALRDRGLPTECLPGVTDVQRVAALIQRPWDDVCVVSARGVDFRKAANLCRARPAVGVLTGPDAGPAELATALAGWRRTLVVLEDVGGPAEELSIVDPTEAAGRAWRFPNVVLCLSYLDRVGTPGWLAGWAPSVRQEDLGAAPEACALAQALLAPRPGSLVWDVVAGAGGIAIEAARRGAAVIAVEHDSGRLVRLRANAQRHGADIRLIDGSVPEALYGLPRPDGVYLGTARADVVETCVAAGADRIVVEVQDLGSIGPARDALADGGYAVDGRLLSSAPLLGLASGGAAVETATSTLLLWGTRR